MDLRKLWRNLRRPRKLKPPVRATTPPASARQIERYLANGRRPWSPGYGLYKDAFIAQRIADADFIARMARGEQLPNGYGEFLDERVVEYPWLLSRLGSNSLPSPLSQGGAGVSGRAAGRLLDAGSILNFPHLIAHPALAGRALTILTLAPEKHCFWEKAVSYVFGDVRELPFRDGWFDEVVCLSTLEHVGKDNTLAGYTADARLKENNADDFLVAIGELKRVCKPGGRVLISVPYGKFTDFGWYQQFDAALIARLVAGFAPTRSSQTYFRYVDGGWRFANAAECADCEGFDFHATRYKNPASTKDYDPDFAACSRAIAALELWK